MIYLLENQRSDQATTRRQHQYHSLVSSLVSSDMEAEARSSSLSKAVATVLGQTSR